MFLFGLIMKIISRQKLKDFDKEHGLESNNAIEKNLEKLSSENAKIRKRLSKKISFYKKFLITGLVFLIYSFCAWAINTFGVCCT